VCHLQAGPGARASLPQNLKASVLTATPDVNERRKIVIAYDGFDVGRQMLTWAAKCCLAAGDELFLLQYQVTDTFRLLPAAMSVIPPPLPGLLWGAQTRVRCFGFPSANAQQPQTTASVHMQAFL